MQTTQPRRCFGQVLYGSSSTLPRDYFRCCNNYFNITFHKDLFIGVRTSQQRGLFLTEPLKANEPVFTIPLESMYTLSNISQQPNTIRSITVDNVRDAITDKEFKLMAPQLYMGMQFAALTSAIPDMAAARTPEEARRIEEICAAQAMPWARMLDDEDFDEKFIDGMYGMALDTWQRRSYDEMTQMFHQCTMQIHETLHLPFKLAHFRRITRLVLARVEHMPPPDYYDAPLWRRRWAKQWRRLRGKPEPQELAMVPLLDMINHSNRPNCDVRVGPSKVLGGKGAITLHSLVAVERGSELCRHYNFALSRPNALFRYGFLPFDLISIAYQDSVTETFVHDKMGMVPVEEEKLRKEMKMQEEVSRLERIFQEAKKGKKPDPRWQSKS